jgi:hypothetical protein
VQLGARQESVTQFALEQSDAPLHFLLVAQFGHDPPPQSTSVSVPFLMESVQVAPAQWPALHESVVQSAPTRQRSVSLHGGQAPPQSMSVSMPFCKRSLQTAALQWKFWQICDRHSESPVHAWSARHAGQSVPPQSVSVSFAFATPSLHVAGWHTCGMLASAPEEALLPASSLTVGATFEQTPVSQSLPPTQSFPVAQGRHGPPQSTSASPSFLVASAQVGD